MSLLFIAGTGTDIGKTYVTAQLARTLHEKGHAVRALKPIISGFDPKTAATSDSALLLKAIGEEVNDETIAAISPWRYATPLAPNMAARREGRVVPDLSAVVSWCKLRGGAVMIEGIGGVMSPISDEATVLDWIKALNCPALLVGGSYLGAISHILTAVETLRAHSVELGAVVVSESENGVNLEETAITLRTYAQVPIAVVPRRGKMPDLITVVVQHLLAC